MRTYFFEKTPGPGIFHFFNLPLEIPDKAKLHSRKFQGQKPRPWKFNIFLVTLGNSTLLDIPYVISLIPLGNFKSLSGIAHYKLVTLAINKAGRY